MMRVSVICAKVSIYMGHVSDVRECGMCESECMNDVSDVSECVTCESECMSDVNDVSECGMCETGVRFRVSFF